MSCISSTNALDSLDRGPQQVQLVRAAPPSAPLAREEPHIWPAAADPIASYLDRLQFANWRVGLLDLEAPRLREASERDLWFYVVLSGEVEIRFDVLTPPCLLRSGETALVGKGVRHRLVGACGSNGEELSAVVATFADGEIGCAAIGRLLPDSGFVSRKRDPENLALEGVFPYLASHLAASSPGSGAVASKLTQAILADTIQSYLIANIEVHAPRRGAAAGPFQASLDPCLGPVLSKVHAHPERDWTVHSMARESGLSRSAFAERFRSTVGVPPLQYVTEVRMRKASRLLETSDMPVKRIAALIGYESVSAFSSAFKRRFGTPPIGARVAAGVRPTEADG